VFGFAATRIYFGWLHSG